jgi:hypothetical protein
VEAERDPDAICEAIGEGRVRVESRPITWALAAQVILALTVAGSPKNGLDRKVGRVDIDDDGLLEMQ